MTQYLTYLESGLGFFWETDEKSNSPPTNAAVTVEGNEKVQKLELLSFPLSCA